MEAKLRLQPISSAWQRIEEKKGRGVLTRTQGEGESIASWRIEEGRREENRKSGDGEKKKKRRRKFKISIAREKESQSIWRRLEAETDYGPTNSASQRQLTPTGAVSGKRGISPKNGNRLQQRKKNRSNKIHLLVVLIRRVHSRVDSHSGSCLASDPIRSFLRPDFCSILQ